MLPTLPPVARFRQVALRGAHTVMGVMSRRVSPQSGGVDEDMSKRGAAVLRVGRTRFLDAWES